MLLLRRRSVLLARRTNAVSSAPAQQRPPEENREDNGTNKENTGQSSGPSSSSFSLTPAFSTSPQQLLKPSAGRRSSPLLSSKKKSAQQLSSLMPTAVSSSSSTSSPASSSSASPAGSARYHRCLYAARSNKKHKSYADGVLEIQGRLCCLYAEDSRPVVKRLAAVGTAAWEEGQTVELGSWEMELCAALEQDDFLTGRCFLDQQAAAPSLQQPATAAEAATVSPSSAPQKPFIPLHSKKLLVSAQPPRSTASAPLSHGSMYDLSDQSLIVLNRAEVEQFASCSSAAASGGKRKRAAAPVPVVVDPYLARQLRPHQVSGLQFMYDCVMGNSNPPHTGCILADEMGLGKCFAAGTRLRLHSGDSIAVQDVREGDALMGDDGSPRMVAPQSLVRGRAALYRISPACSGAEAFTVNGEHILVLVNTAWPSIAEEQSGGWAVSWYEVSDSNKMQQRTFTYALRAEAEAGLSRRLQRWRPLEWEVTVDSFLASPVCVQRVCQLFHSGPVTFQSGQRPRLQDVLAAALKHLPSPAQLARTAWYFGLKISGACDHGSYGLLPAASRLLRSMRQGEQQANYWGKMGFDVVVSQLLQAYGLHSKRLHIVPQSVICDSLLVRRCVLAGIVDGAGDEWSGSIHLQTRQLAQSCRLLASSLGIKSSGITRSKSEPSWTVKSLTRYSLRLRDRLLAVGRCRASSLQYEEAETLKAEDDDVSSRSFGFSVTAAGVGSYYGFAVTGVNRRFLLADFTVTHNVSPQRQPPSPSCDARLSSPYSLCSLCAVLLSQTLQSIALLYTMLRSGPMGTSVLRKAVVVCPSSLVGNWRHEFSKWLGSERLRVLALESSSKTEEQRQNVAAFVAGNVNPVLILSYEMFRKHQDRLRALPDCLFICDEGHRLKNSRGNRTVAALQSVQSRRRLLLTGTPVQNDLLELFAMCDFVNPSALGSLSTFRRAFEVPISRSREMSSSADEKRLGEARSRQLSSMTEGFVLRRTSELLRQYLPAKHELVLYCRMQDMQRDVYVEVLRSKTLRKAVDSGEQALALTCIHTLTQISNHPALVYTQCREMGQELGGELSAAFACFPPDYEAQTAGREAESGKMRVLMELLAGVQAEAGSKVVVVSNYVRTLDIMQSLCSARSWPVLRLDGQQASDRRQEAVDVFNSPYNSTRRIFLLSAKAGGLGINLIGGNRLVLFDPDWNPATDLQAMARVWRDGQQLPVAIYRLLTLASIDEKIFQRQLRKQEVTAAVMDDRKGAGGRQAGRAAGGGGGGSDRVFDSKSLRVLFKYSGRSDCESYDVLKGKAAKTAEQAEEAEEAAGSCGDGDARRGKEVLVGRKRWQVAWSSGESEDELVQRLPPGLVSCVWSRLSKAEEEDVVNEAQAAQQSLTQEEAEEEALLHSLAASGVKGDDKEDDKQSAYDHEEQDEEAAVELELAQADGQTDPQDERDEDEDGREEQDSELDEAKAELLQDELEAMRLKEAEERRKRKKREAQQAARDARLLQQEQEEDEDSQRLQVLRVEKRRRMVEADSEEEEFMPEAAPAPAAADSLPHAAESAEQPENEEEEEDQVMMALQKLVDRRQLTARPPATGPQFPL